jgi:hypothetical protein
MRRLLTFLTFALTASLGGCYISETPLVGAGDAVFPYETISYRETDGDEIMTMVREGDAYVMRKEGEPGQLELRFKDLGDNLYLAQMTGEQDGKPAILYSVVKADWNKKTVDSYKAVADMAEEGPGLRKCGDNALCIDDLDRYLALARKAVSGGEPVASYEIVEAK